MKKMLKTAIKKLTNIYHLLIKHPLYKNRVLKFYKSSSESEKYSTELSYLKKHKVAYLLGVFKDKYLNMKIKTFYDREKKLHYVIYDSYRLYFKKNMSVKNIIDSYKQLLIEQDEESAHKYESRDFYVKNNDILFDIGAAEGIFALSVIDKIKKGYLFEYDKDWIEALKATFASFPGKIEIIQKFVSDFDDDITIKLDTVTGNMPNTPIFIKIDVEGSENKVLRGMDKLITKNDSLKIAVCTYHRKNDAEEFEKFFKNKNFKTEFSNGFMLYHLNPRMIKPPFFIKGLLRAYK